MAAPPNRGNAVGVEIPLSGEFSTSTSHSAAVANDSNDRDDASHSHRLQEDVRESSVDRNRADRQGMPFICQPPLESYPLTLFQEINLCRHSRICHHVHLLWYQFRVWRLSRTL